MSTIINRTEECLDKKAKYPALMQELCFLYSDHQALEAENGTMTLAATASAHALKSLWLKIAGNTALATTFQETEGVNQRRGGHNAFDILTDEKTSFFGMGVTQLRGELLGESQVMQERLTQAMEELEKTGLKESIEQGSGFKRRRKRIFSDCEGSFEYDRRQDDMPFSRMISHKKEFPTVEFIIPLANSGGVNHEEISRFGARCLALADIMEKAGYRVGITGEIWGHCAQGTVKGKKVDVSGARFPIRSANEYGDIQSIALFVSGEFYRRVLFPLYYEAANYIHGLNPKTKLSQGYGGVQFTRPIPKEAGQVYLDADLMRYLFSGTAMNAETMFKERILWQLRTEEWLGRAV